MSHFDCFALSEQGAGLETNDDFAALDAERGIFIVADGMGGRPGGARASSVAVNSFLEQMRSMDGPARLEESILRRALARANSEVRSIGAADPLFSGLGTTLSAVVMNGTQGKLVHVGDSRIYLFRDGELRQLTRDHTLAAELLERKHVSPEGARRHPLRHVLSRSLGSQDVVEPDLGDLVLTRSDWLILATDGLTKALAPERLRHLLAAGTAENAEAMCREVMKAAISQNPDDNVTLAVARLAG